MLMKKLSKIALSSGQILQNEEMKKISGGRTYICYCSLSSVGGNQGYLVDIPDYDGIDAAYEMAKGLCGSRGVAYCDRYN